jgi:hypothetical protein
MVKKNIKRSLVFYFSVGTLIIALALKHGLKACNLTLGRDRQSANLGDFADFPTNVADGTDQFELNIENIKITENVKAFVWRGPGGK